MSEYLKPASFEIPPPPVPEEQITGTLTADVVVVGEGLAGLCAALPVRQAGAETRIVTASSRPVPRGGSVFASYSRIMAAHGLPRPDLDGFFLEEFAANSFQVDQRKWYTLLDRSEEAMDWLADILEKEGLEVVLEDANRDDCHSPTWQPPGTHAFVGRGVTRAGTGMSLAVAALEKTFLEAGGEVLHSTPARYLEKADGRVTAVVVQKPGGDYLRLKARKGVILATGDFSANKEMMAKYCPQYAPDFTSAGDDYDVGFAVRGLYRGEGQQMALWAGAAWQKTWPCAVMIQGSRLGTSMPYGSHRGLRLNRRGERYCNEDMNGAYTALTTLREPGGQAYAIWGSNYARETVFRAHGGRREDPDLTPEQVTANWEDQVSKGQLVKGDTPEAVAEALGLPVEATMETIRRYNALCRAGKDGDFHKKPKYLQEIREAPFYGCSLSDRLFFTVLGGPRTNYKMQMCDGRDEPIAGLWCVGGMVGDRYANCYNFRSPGQSYGACLTFGYLTGKRVAEE